MKTATLQENKHIALREVEGMISACFIFARNVDGVVKCLEESIAVSAQNAQPKNGRLKTQKREAFKGNVTEPSVNLKGRTRLGQKEELGILLLGTLKCTLADKYGFVQETLHAINLLKFTTGQMVSAITVEFAFAQSLPHIVQLGLITLFQGLRAGNIPRQICGYVAANVMP